MEEKRYVPGENGKKLEYISDGKMTVEEVSVIERFLDLYRKQDKIIADEYRQDSSIVPLKESSVIFKKSDDTWKSIDIERVVRHKGTPYKIELGLWRCNGKESISKILRMNKFSITTPTYWHPINLETALFHKSNDILFDIMDVFREDRIISPEEAHCKRMKTKSELQHLIANHEWVKIVDVVKLMPNLSSTLFLIEEGWQSITNYEAYFGTILYQLLTFRINNKNEMSNDDLNMLDAMIHLIKDSDLLKVKLQEKHSSVVWYPDPILIPEDESSSILHLSKQYTVFNGELDEEAKELKKVLKYQR